MISGRNRQFAFAAVIVFLLSAPFFTAASLAFWRTQSMYYHAEWVRYEDTWFTVGLTAAVVVGSICVIRKPTSISLGIVLGLCLGAAMPPVCIFILSLFFPV